MEGFKLFLKDASDFNISTLRDIHSEPETKKFENDKITFETTVNASKFLIKSNILIFVLGDIAQTPSAYCTNAAQTVFEVYQRKGASGLTSFSGHFLIGILDGNTQSVHLINDKFSTRPLYFKTIGSSFAASNKLSELVSLLPQKPTLNKQAIYNYIYFHCIPSPDTIYESIYKLEPTKHLIYKNKTLSTNTYWKPSYTDENKLNKNQLAEELRSSLNDEIACWRDRPDVGAFLSGGLDSSTVTAFLAKNNSLPANTFTIGFAEPGYDESGYAEIIAKKFNTNHHVRYVTPQDIFDYIPNIANYYDEPFGNSSALPAFFCAKEALQHGVSTLLAGDGGDELYAGNERYAKQKLYRYYEAIPSHLRGGLDATVKTLSKMSFPLASKAESYIFQAKQTTPERLQFYNFLHQNSPDTVFSEQIIKSVNQNIPIENYQARYNEVNAPLIDRMLYLDWKFTLADNDLVKVNNMTSMAGVNVKYPMLCEGLLRNSLKIPAQMKLPGNKLRDFYKYSLKDVLPEETINKSKHGFGLPFGSWLSKEQQLKDLSNDALNQLKKRDLFDEQFITKAQNLHNQADASYHGELVWIMMMLELWLDSHENSFA